MKKIVKKVILPKIKEKWEMGIRILFKNYQTESITDTVNGITTTLFFRDIISLHGEGNYTTYYMSNGTRYVRDKGLGLCCLELPWNHFGRFCKGYAMNYHFYIEHSLGKICEVLLFGDYKFIVSRDEKKRFLITIKLFKICFGLRIPRIRKKKP